MTCLLFAEHGTVKARVVQKSGHLRNSMGVRFFWATLYIVQSKAD